MFAVHLSLKSLTKFLTAFLLLLVLTAFWPVEYARQAQASGAVEKTGEQLPNQKFSTRPDLKGQFDLGYASPQAICYVPPLSARGMAAAGAEAPLSISELITYTTQDVNMQVGLILNDWITATDTITDVKSVSLTIWWNNPSETLDDGPQSSIVEPPDDVIQDIWLYQNAFSVSDGASGAGGATMIAHHEPETVRGAWVITVSVSAGEWFTLRFHDTYATFDNVDGGRGSDLTWSAPVGYDPTLHYLTSFEMNVPSQDGQASTWERFIDTNSVSVRYLNPAEYCAANGLDAWLCDLSVMVLVWNDSPTQGQQIAIAHQADIAALAETYQIPAISLAAGIANQANAFTRPFGTDFLEMCLLGLPDGPFTGDGASVGVAQITPDEMKLYLPGCDEACLFDRHKSFEMMAVKLSEANALLPSDIDATERLMVLALAQNNGIGPAQAYLDAHGDWQLLHDQFSQGGYAWDQGDWDQLDKILRIMAHLLEQGYSLPDGVDLERWQQIYDFGGQP